MGFNRNRAALLNMIGRMPFGRRTARRSLPLSEQDYVGFPLPVNLPAAPHGNCLIWVASLNDDGYGIGTFPSGEKLAHREAFLSSRGYAGENVLHLCHRPYCIQPSHLYTGSKRDNADDRRLRLADSLELELELVSRASDEVRKAAPFRLLSPKSHQLPLVTPDVAHDCEFIVPAGDERVCSICSEPQSAVFRGEPRVPDWQPDDIDRNKSSVVNNSRRFTDLGAFTVESNIATQIDLPMTRAERRRVEREQRKLAKKGRYDKPVLLSSFTHLIGPDGLHIQGEIPALNIPGSGVLVCVATTRPVPQALASHLAKQRLSKAEAPLECVRPC